MKFICLILGLLSIFTLRIDAGIDLEKQAIDAMSDALDLSKQFLSETVPPKTTVNEVIQDGTLYGDVVTILLDGQDSHFRVAQNVREWCGLATDLLSTYEEFVKSSEDETTRKGILLDVLEDEIDKLRKAQVNFNSFFSSLREAAGKIRIIDAKSEAIQRFAEATGSKHNRVHTGLQNQIEILENLKVQIEASRSDVSTPQLQFATIDSVRKLTTNCV